MFFCFFLSQLLHGDEGGGRGRWLAGATDQDAYPYYSPRVWRWRRRSRLYKNVSTASDASQCLSLSPYETTSKRKTHISSDLPLKPKPLKTSDENGKWILEFFIVLLLLLFYYYSYNCFYFSCRSNFIGQTFESLRRRRSGTFDNISHDFLRLFYRALSI